QLLLIHERSASRHDIVFGFEFDNGTCRGRGLFTQRLKPLLQPVSRTSICLVLSIQLIEYVGIDHCIGDFDGLLSVMRAKINFHYVTRADPSDIKLLGKCSDRFSNALRLRFGFGSFPSETGEELVESVKQIVN